jgi:predicted unusual protein kinase regulating ubiquinone biosynthesis (AarF/ABC1/UbiB family)
MSTAIIDQSEFKPEFILKKKYFISHKTEDIYDYFNIDPEPIGQGSFGIVYKGTEKETKQVRAIKQIGVAHIKDKT